MKEIYYRKMLSVDDLALTPFYFLLIIFAAYFIRNIVVGEDKLIVRYFIPGLILKLLGAICVGLIYFFYYKGGDTTEYYNNALVYYGALSENPATFFRLIQAPNNFTDPAILDYKGWLYFHRDSGAFFFGKITGVFGIFGFGIYTTTALLMTAVSYWGVWSLYKTFYNIYPELYKEFALAILFIPSVVFWGSGILKDSFSFSGAGLCIAGFYNIFIANKNKAYSVFIILIGLYICYSLKPYIVMALLPALTFWYVLTFRLRIKSPFTRILAGPVAILLASVIGLFTIKKLGEENAKYSVQGALKTAELFQDWHTQLAETQNSSGYSLGEMTGTTANIISKIPAAINVTLFRPYVWETRNPVMLLSALESMFMLILTIKIFWRTGLRPTLKSIISNPTVFFCLFYSLFFAFCVGFTAYNFGALVRYKIPCIPIFLCGLYILNMQTKLDTAKKTQRISKVKLQPI